MFHRLIKQIRLRLMARQLRKPRGNRGLKVGDMMNRANEFLYDQTFAIMNPLAGEHLLEIGFGNGLFFGKFLQVPGTIRMKGIDSSAGMVQAARQLNQNAITAGLLDICQGSSASLPYPDDHFDKVYCINVIYFWDHPGEHLAEVKRVLKPGGRFYATIRTRESMELMPFTKYGFRKYDEAGWDNELRSAGLQLEEARSIQEPAVEFHGKAFSIQSLCLVAIKKTGS